MARTKTEIQIPAPAPALIEGKFDELTNNANELVTLQADQARKAIAVAQQIGYEGAMTVGALEDEIRFYQRRTVEAILETGKRLLVLKELTPHGEFSTRVELLGLAKTTAFRFMQAAAKTAKSSKLELLGTQVKNASAFLELVTHDDDVLDGLQDMDDFDRMSASQLRQAARELQANSRATAQLLAAKDEKLNDLARQVKKFNIHKDIPDAFVPLHALTGALRSEAVKKVQALVQCGRDAISQEPASEEEKQVYVEQFATLSTTIFDSLEAIRLELDRAFKQFDESIGVHMPLPSAE